MNTVSQKIFDWNVSSIPGNSLPPQPQWVTPSAAVCLSLGVSPSTGTLVVEDRCEILILNFFSAWAREFKLCGVIGIDYDMYQKITAL